MLANYRSAPVPRAHSPRSLRAIRGPQRPVAPPLAANPRRSLAILALGLLTALACAVPAAAPPAAPATAVAAPAAPSPPPPSGAATAGRPAGAAASAADARLPTPTTLKFGYTPLLSGAPIFIALERGYFEELNLNLDMIRFNSGALMVAPLASNELDLGSGGISPGLFNALLRDIRLRIVGDGSSSRPGYGTSIALVRKDLWDSGAIRSPADLRGRRVSFATEGSPIDYMMRNLLAQNGLRQEEMEVLRLTSADVAVGLQNRALDVATAAEPFPTQAESGGFAVKWLADGDVVPNTQIGAILASERMLTQPEAGRAFMLAYVRAIREYLAADAGRGDEGMLAAISKWTTVPVETLRGTGTPYFRPSGRVDVEDLDRQQTFWIREGVMREKADLTPVVDQSYVDYVEQVLGNR